jgi:hypothetical protein
MQGRSLMEIFLSFSRQLLCEELLIAGLLFLQGNGFSLLLANMLPVRVTT